MSDTDKIAKAIELAEAFLAVAHTALAAQGQDVEQIPALWVQHGYERIGKTGRTPGKLYRDDANSYTVPLYAGQPRCAQADAPSDGDFWPCDSSMSRKQLVKRIGQMNFRLTALRKENEGLRKKNNPQADADKRDAMRWRWVRMRWARFNESYEGDQLTEIRPLTQEEIGSGEGWTVDPKSLDASIDAAIAVTGAQEAA
jgi:hypothetical protein